MKNFKKNLHLPLFLILGLFFISNSSCKKDNPKQDAINLLVGDWDVTSFTEDGAETIGSGISNFEMEYDPYKTDEGDFKWTILYDYGTSDIINGEYDVNAEGDELELKFNSGGAFDFEMTIDEDDLTIEGNLDGYYVIIRADK